MLQRRARSGVPVNAVLRHPLHSLSVVRAIGLQKPSRTPPPIELSETDWRKGSKWVPLSLPKARKRIEGLIQAGADEGAQLLVDGRYPSISGGENGNFIRPTILNGLNPEGEIVKTEIFGPVLGLIHVETIDDAIELINSGSYGNMACLFTSSGASARKFRYEAEIGNIGINIGVAAPMAFFPFSGWKDSFFGDLHGQSWDAVDFFTQKKVVVERWA